MEPGKRQGASRRVVPRLTEMEWDVVKPLWEKGPLAARDIYQLVPEERGWAYKTVKTMLARLVQKRALTYVQVVNSYLYEAAFTRKEITKAATRSFVQRVFDGALRPFVAQFMEQVSPEEIEVLKTELARIERLHGKKKRPHG
jgi:BlaI family transcriptional regulator, penicillinase repressor